jgi:Fe-S cluster assembly iron-binding protein IscA
MGEVEMFGFTADAATLIRSLVRRSGLDEGGGLRMSINPTRGSLAMSLAPGPDTTDHVFTHHDVSVFVASAAAARLNARTLDARVTDPSPAFFLLDS